MSEASEPIQVSFLLDAIFQLAPRSLLDVGCAKGVYGVLFREYFPLARIDAIEGFPNCPTVLYRSVYNNIFAADDLIPQVEMPRVYSLAIMIDTFEHLPTAEGEELLKVLKLRAESVLLCVPVLPQYNPAALKRLGFSQVFTVDDHYVALSGRKRIHLYRHALQSLASILPHWCHALADTIRGKFHS